MGLLGLFNKEQRQARTLSRACAKASNKKIKPEDRRPALDYLVGDSSEAAMQALLGRFTFNYENNMVSDEEEKNVAYEGLVARGPEALGPLRQHLKTAPTLSWGLRLLAAIADHETVWQVLSEVLAGFEPGYDRDPSRKIQLLAFVGEFDDPRAAAALLPYLTDHDETVRFTAIDGLFARADESVREALLEILVDPEEDSLRLKNRIADGFAAAGWSVKGFRGGVEEALSGDFFVDGKGHIKRRGPAAASKRAE